MESDKDDRVKRKARIGFIRLDPEFIVENSRLLFDIRNLIKNRNGHSSNVVHPS